MEYQFKLYTNSPIGYLEISGSEEFVQSILFKNGLPTGKSEHPLVLIECRTQLEEYFQGTRRSFDFPFELEGTEFQKKVWELLLRIPFGETRSYGEIARELGNIKLMRAVGMANGKNPLTIVVPCHRVIGSDNKLVGYGGGLERKDWLLKHEKKVSGIEHQLDIFH
jgi:methylated-DNA-[protein]-cysteine S-methyltransferase